jgi:hypothetical protein
MAFFRMNFSLLYYYYYYYYYYCCFTECLIKLVEELKLEFNSRIPIASKGFLLHEAEFYIKI